jgi:DNA-binding LacI/PurR family transcriptional regulator
LVVLFQNGFLGGAQAADHLVERGHRRIAWYGQINEGVHSATRFGGALTTLGRHGLELSSDCRIDALKPGAAAELGRLLAGPGRPTAVLALWGPHLREAAAVVRKLGLAIGRDVELVGWTTVEQYDQSIASHFRGERVPPVVEWSIADMAEMAIDRLASRREHPKQRPVVINIQTRIRPAQENPTCA